MKIRIHGNSVRFRLSKSEVEQLGIEEYLEDKTSFGTTQFTYAIKTDHEADTLTATYEKDQLTMYIPATFTASWFENNVVGLENNMPLDGADSLYLLVEKDFKCLDNVLEDQSDNYENPNKTC